MQKPVTDVRSQLWKTLLIRLELGVDTATKDHFFFTLEKGEVEGIDVFNFQSMAIKKLAQTGAFIKIEKVDHPLQKEVGPQYPLQSIGFNVFFEKKVLRSALRRMRIANELGDLDAEPIFELTLEEANLVVIDLEKDHVYNLHRLQYDSQADQLFGYMFGREKFQMTRKELDVTGLAIDKKLGKIVRDAKLKGPLLGIFAPVVKNDRIELKPIITSLDLENADVSKETLREHLAANAKGRKST